MRIKLKEVELYYEVVGAGEPLILLHGNGESLGTFDKLVPHLAKYYTVYAIDSRNHGNSSKNKKHSYQAMMFDIEQFINSLKLSPVNIIGFSDGAIVTLMLCLQVPTLVNKMALLGVNLTPEDFLPEFIEKLSKDYSMNADPLTELMLNEPQIDASELRKVEQSVLIVFGDNDIFNKELLSKLENNIMASETVILPNQTHDSYILNNDCLAERLLEFFSANSSF